MKYYQFVKCFIACVLFRLYSKSGYDAYRPFIKYIGAISSLRLHLMLCNYNSPDFMQVKECSTPTIFLLRTEDCTFITAK